MIIYTAIFGRKDRLRPIASQAPAVCFTDEPVEADGWDVRVVPVIEGPVYSSRLYKMLPHRFLDDPVTLYLDGNMRLIQDPSADYSGLVAESEDGFCVHPHPERTCVYRELDACKRLKKAPVEALELQEARYRQEGMPEENGLWAGTVILRDGRSQQLSEEWFTEYGTWRTRDQPSLAYVLWKRGMRPAPLPGGLWGPGVNPYYRRVPHAW